MRVKLALSILLVAALALFGTGCNKATGGGKFTDEWTGNKVTFGFNGQPTSGGETPFVNAKGQFQLVDHGTKTNIHGTFTGTYDSNDETASWFSGTCSINGEGENYFDVTVTDLSKPGIGAGDYIVVLITGVGTYQGYLEGGNIQVHKAKKAKK